MKTIAVTRESEVPSPHIMFIGDVPEAAAMAFVAKFKQDAPVVYTLGKRVFIPVKDVSKFWTGMDNGCD